MEAMKAKANHETDWLPEMSELAPEAKLSSGSPLLCYFPQEKGEPQGQHLEAPSKFADLSSNELPSAPVLAQSKAQTLRGSLIPASGVLTIRGMWSYWREPRGDTDMV